MWSASRRDVRAFVTEACRLARGGDQALTVTIAGASTGKKLSISLSRVGSTFAATRATGTSRRDAGGRGSIASGPPTHASATQDGIENCASTIVREAISSARRTARCLHGQGHGSQGHRTPSMPMPTRMSALQDEQLEAASPLSATLQSFHNSLPADCFWRDRILAGGERWHRENVAAGELTFEDNDLILALTAQARQRVVSLMNRAYSP